MQQDQKKDLRQMVINALNRRLDDIEETFIGYDGESFAGYHQLVVEIVGEEVILHFSLACRAKFAAQVLRALNGFNPKLGDRKFITVRNNNCEYQILWGDEAIVEHARLVQVLARPSQEKLDHRRKMEELKSSEPEKDIEF